MGVRLYDIANDDFITDRAKIIDALVAMAASTLTFAQRRQNRTLGQRHPSNETMWFLRSTQGTDREDWIGRAVLERQVKALWRDQVQVTA